MRSSTTSCTNGVFSSIPLLIAEATIPYRSGPFAFIVSHLSDVPFFFYPFFHPRFPSFFEPEAAVSEVITAARRTEAIIVDREISVLKSTTPLVMVKLTATRPRWVIGQVKAFVLHFVQRPDVTIHEQISLHIEQVECDGQQRISRVT